MKLPVYAFNHAWRIYRSGGCALFYSRACGYGCGWCCAESWAHSLATACGILTGNSIYFVVSALGIASVILASHAVFVVVKWCGAGYLAYLGIRALMTSVADAQGSIVPTDPHRLTRGWASGTITQLANPKALVFFAAIVPQFIDPHANVALQIGILAIAGLVVEFVVLSTYIAAADRIRRRGIAPASRIWAERVGGVFMLGVAASVVRE